MKKISVNYLLVHIFLIALIRVEKLLIEKNKTETETMGCASSVDIKQTKLNGKRKSKSDSGQNEASVLTDQQIQLIYQTWKLVTHNKLHIGTQIFLNIFDSCPMVKSLFHFDHLSGKELLENATFKSHASRFTQVIDTAIHGLDNLEVVVSPVMRNLGRLHIRKKGFTTDYTNIFILSMMKSFKEELGDDLTNEAQEAWIILLNFMMDKMKDGYDLANKKPKLNIH